MNSNILSSSNDLETSSLQPGAPELVGGLGSRGAMPPSISIEKRRAEWNKRAGLEKSATLLAYLLSKLINEQGEFFVYYMKNCEQGGKEI